MSYIGPLTQDILKECTKELKKKHNRERISKYVIDPAFREITNKFYGYYLTLIFLQVLIICLLVYLAINIKK